MSTENNEDLKQFAYEAWLKRERPSGSPDVDWEAARKRKASEADQHATSSAPGSTPTDLGADLLPASSHDK